MSVGRAAQCDSWGLYSWEGGRAHYWRCFHVLMGKWEKLLSKASTDSHRIAFHLIWMCMNEKKDNIISILSYPFNKRK